MNKNIIVIGDSFASCSGGWPSILADMLGLELTVYGGAGEHWWPGRQFLKNVSQHIVENTEVIIFVHTYFDRITRSDSGVHAANIHDENDNSEIVTAARLYFKYISDPNFMKWAQEMWFKEVTEQWQHIKLVNLHSFPWSLENKNALPGGINLIPSLAAISLNEMGADKLNFIDDIRPNHLNDYNNKELATQLASIITNYSKGTKFLNLETFDQKTHKWDNWK